MKNYNRENCQGKIRRIILDNKFHNVALIGIHAFEYEICISNKTTGSVKSFIYPNRTAAIKDISRIKGQYLLHA